MSEEKKQGDGIVHQIQNATEFSPAPEGLAVPKLEDIKKMMTELKGKSKPDHSGPDFFETYGHLIGKTREELEEIISDGLYDIGSGGWICYTGKGGLINAILNFNENMKNAAKEAGFLK